MTYRLYGLTLESALSLPCQRVRPRRADVRLVAGSAREFAAIRPRLRNRRGDWFHCRRLTSGAMYLQWTDHFEFLISADGRRILYRALDKSRPESLHVYLLGQVLSFSLLARGADPLHGTVVAAADGAAIGFLGQCGAGKSTMAAAMLARGCRIVTDDVAAIVRRDGRWFVHRGIPRLKLFPRTARRLLGSGRASTLMISGTAKRVVALSPDQIAGTMAPLKALYVLSEPRGRRAQGEGVSIESLGGGDALLEIVRAAFNLIVRDRDRVTNQFALATSVASQVPVRRLTYPRDLGRLPAVCDRVLADAASL